MNGTFRDETQNLSSLGLSPVVMKALANGTEVSMGVFGAPRSVARPPPPTPCSGVGCVWNTVSGVYSTIVGFVGAVWNTVVATANYIHNLAYGMANLVAKGAEWVVATTANKLEAVGTFLEDQLQALLAFVEKEVKDYLMMALGPITNEFSNMIHSYIHPASLALTGPGGGLANPIPDTFGEALFGAGAETLLELSAGIVIAAIVVFAVLDGVTLGASDAVLIVLPIIIGLILLALSSFGPLSGSGIASAIQGVLSIMWKAAVDTSGGFIVAAAIAANRPLSTSQTNQLNDLTSQIDTGTGILDALLGLGIDALIFLKSGGLAKAGKSIASAFSLMLSVISIAVFAYLVALASPSDNIRTIVGQALDVTAIAVNFIALANNLRTLIDSGSDFLQRRVANLQVLMELIGMSAEGLLYSS